MAASSGAEPDVTIVILNYNGAKWMRRCLESIREQTIFGQLEIVVADNASTDKSDTLADEMVKDWPNGIFIQNGANLGFGRGSNLAVNRAHGEYLFFLNPDVWLEPECMEQLLTNTRSRQAGGSGALVLDYDTNDIQTRGGVGFDGCNRPVGPRPGVIPDTLFIACGFYFIRTDLFRRLGGFDDEFFLYGEEEDLSWRVWIAGERIIHVPSARIHHRGAVAVNPEGGTKIVESRTSDFKRFYANRNSLLVLLKNCQHVLLLLLLPALLLLLAESLAGWIVLRRWSFFRKTCLGAIVDCWRLRGHIARERRRVASYRRHSDFWMLRFLSWRFSRWEEVRRALKMGVPKVDAR